MIYNKLVRDRIPEIIKAKGEEVKFHIADDDEYLIKLKEKLIEEAEEFMQDEDQEEIVDILETIDAIIAFKDFKREEINEIKNKKAEVRGKFESKIILEES